MRSDETIGARGHHPRPPKFLSRAGNALLQAIRATLKRFFPENVSIKLYENVSLKEVQSITIKLGAYDYITPDECRFCNPPEQPRYSEYETPPEYWWTTCPLHGQVFRKNIKIKTFPENITWIRPVPVVPGNVKYTYGPIEYTYPPSWFRIRTGV